MGIPTKWMWGQDVWTDGTFPFFAKRGERRHIVATYQKTFRLFPGFHVKSPTRKTDV